ncbi:receptor-type tyrosine-protein phosphatase alpha-like [Notothenia coriiceps]|uniref:protein-tyrosine-phosphatase n=1 Tax=Notothenia coriiceps TaxID=8208 RepID=A0A6I9PXK8_9TELE|nr:PREDICTED: receptor-type tyrosine-protein phosphatase alpha-like [Notothenia coriiceps]
MPTSLLQGRMGVCPLLLLLALALGASAQDHVPITNPPSITAKPTDPLAAPSLNFTVAHTQAPTGPPTTLAPAVIPVTTITTTEETTTGPPAGEGDVQLPGPSATALLPIPAPSPPTDAPAAPPSTEPPPPPIPAGGDNETTAFPPETPTPDYDDEDIFNLEPETTTEPGMGFTSDSSPHDNNQSDDMPIIAVMVALSSLLVIIFIIIILYMLRFKKYKQAGSHSNSFRLTNGRSDEAELQSVPLLARSPSTNRKYPPLHVDKLEEDMNRRMADDNKLFREEFNSLPVCPIQASVDAASKEENKEKNRYVNILPYDHSRVHLSSLEGVPDSDFINASFINGYQEKNKFIAAQGPKEETVNDYWRMIWEQNTATIVMVTNLKERKEVGEASENKARAVRQFHFHGWPEVGIPADGKGMINIIAAVQKQQQQSGNHPITVHCSAGAGRTGTFCALSTVLERVKAEGILDVFQTVKSLRLQRPHMVQTLEQYEFCYKVVQEYIDAFSDYANFK